jgi:uncharacterized protein
MKVSRRRLLWLFLSIGVLLLLERAITGVQVDFWWFQALGYLENFQRQWLSQTLLALAAGLCSALWLGLHLWLGRCHGSRLSEHLDAPILLVARPLVSAMTKSGNWYFLAGLWSIGVLFLLEPWNWWGALPALGNWPIPAGALALGLFVLLVIGMSLWFWPLLVTLTLALCLEWAYFWSEHWMQVLPALVPSSFQQQEPVFGRDLSFYIFQLPVWETFDRWSLNLALSSLGLTLLLYLYPHLVRGWWYGFERLQQRHLAGILGAIGLWGFQHFLLRQYQLLYSQRGVVYGAGYADLLAYLPLDRVASWACLGLGLYLLGAAANIWQLGRWRPGLTWLLLASGLVYGLLPIAVQRSLVAPNEMTLEQPYLQRSIAATRRAFGLDRIEVQTFDPNGQLTATDIAKNDPTIRNIRLWDARPLLQSNRELQQIRPYYKFANADIDRYQLAGQSQQVMLSAREIDSKSLRGKANTWVNRHLVYTHGYGFTVSPVNRAAAGGLPDYLVKDIETRSSLPEFAIDHPRIYYGEVTQEYAFAPSQVQEQDYVSGSETFYNTYSGGGIPIDHWWRRWATARHLQDWQALLTENFRSDTKLLLHRSIQDRAHKLAPWLTLDRDPYLVIAAVGGRNRLYWLLDAYTGSDHYPYADPGNKKFNYLRNSVKISIDAEDGTTNFYVSDDRDPILQTWRKLLPNMWQPLSKMPAALRQHLRYPSDLFQVQVDRLRTYHMEDPQIFYSREDLWQIPQEIYGGQAQAVEPYYLITKLLTAPREEFMLLTPFTPSQRTNLIAWLGARSDGEQYGKLLLYQFPKQRLVYGTEQVEALINQDPAISQQISLWNRQGVTAVQGNLLVIPIERSLLYVEPLYLEAQQNSLPTLGRTIVVYGDRITMAESLTQALQKIFPAAGGSSP